MKSALVTGGGRRIGAAAVKALAEDGYAVFIHYNRSAEAAEEVARTVRARGGTAHTLRAELDNPEEAERLIAACAEIGPAPSVLLNNASLFRNDHIEDMTAEGWERHMTVNALAPALLTREFARRLPGGGTGVVINFLDQKLDNLNPDFFTYTISKYALKGVTEVMAMALAPRVRVCGLAPGLTLPSGKMTGKQFERAHRANPLRRGAEVEDLVRAVRFILQTPSYTGQMLMVDGGQHFDKRGRDVMYSVDE